MKCFWDTKMSKKLTEDQFLKEVAEHQLSVIREDGLYRHLRFRKAGTMFDHFDIVTWPGVLCFTGDTGTYVFRPNATLDVLQFFTGQARKRQGTGSLLGIAPRHWSEKLEAADSAGVRQYSEAKFRACIAEWLDNLGADTELREAVDDEVLPEAEMGEDAALRAVSDFRHHDRDVFSDFHECDIREYTFRYLWCCYALAWGALEYDKARQPQATAA